MQFIFSYKCDQFSECDFVRNITARRPEDGAAEEPEDAGVGRVLQRIVVSD